MPTDADVLQGYRGPFDHGYIFAERRDEPFVCLAQVMPERSEE
jgi:hypothetical protein